MAKIVGGCDESIPGCQDANPEQEEYDACSVIAVRGYPNWLAQSRGCSRRRRHDGQSGKLCAHSNTGHCPKYLAHLVIVGIASVDIRHFAAIHVRTVHGLRFSIESLRPAVVRRRPLALWGGPVTGVADWLRGAQRRSETSLRSEVSEAHLTLSGCPVVHARVHIS
eukprot:scaffold7214_cov410-Prasinococcus_capsulatus_cf.AAC.23